MSRILQNASFHQGIRAGTRSMFTTSAKSASAESALPEVASSKSMKELSEGAMYGMIPTKGRYANFVIKEQKRLLNWKWWNPDSPVHQSTKKEDRLMYSILGACFILTGIKYCYTTGNNTNFFKYNWKA